MALQDLIRLVLPKEDHFFDFLERQASLAYDGARKLRDLETRPVAEVRPEVHAIEKAGDKAAHELEDALSATFVTPLDREDLHRLSTMLDDILDRAYAAASAFDMFHIAAATDEARKQMEILEQSTKLLSETLPSLRKHDFETIRKAVREMKVLEKQGDEVYRSTMKQLFGPEGPTDARELIRRKEVTEILENAIDTCEDAAEFLANLAVKNG
jgi:predicted phosphate transport protein (TIGR00153 family)